MRLALLASGALALGLFGALAPGVAEGRAGNEALAAGDAAAAESLYVTGLVQEGAPPEARAGLYHNLGVARAAAGRPAEADSAFADALPWAADPERRARTLYGAGTAALGAGDLGRAVEHLRRSLLLRPGYIPAQVNLEIALLRQRQDEEDPPEQPEPSAYAQELKAEADALVEQRRYADAFALMQEGLARDSTVQAFGDYIQRLGEVTEIDTAPPASGDASSGAAPSPAPLP